MSPKFCIIVLTLILSVGARAQSSGFLGKPEVEAMASGKVWMLLRASDQQKVRWDLRKNNQLFGNNLSRSSSDNGTWSITDAGQLCVKWRGNSVDVCLHVKKTGERYQLYNAKEPEVLHSDLSLEP